MIFYYFQRLVVFGLDEDVASAYVHLMHSDARECVLLAKNESWMR